jgi:quercetin dioxygenase-like cupin family protein
MSEVRPYVRRAGEGEALWFLGNRVSVKAGGAETRGRATVLEFENPPGFAPPLHVHGVEDELVYLLAGAARFSCGGERFEAGRGDFVMMPAGLPHTFLVGPGDPMRALLICAPSGFERFVAEAGEAALDDRPPADPESPETMAVIAARHGIEILGPPPTEI